MNHQGVIILGGGMSGLSTACWRAPSDRTVFAPTPNLHATDLAAWETQYGSGTLAAATVPEPSSIALLVTSLLCMTFRRRS